MATSTRRVLEPKARRGAATMCLVCALGTGSAGCTGDHDGPVRVPTPVSRAQGVTSVDRDGPAMTPLDSTSRPLYVLPEAPEVLPGLVPERGPGPRPDIALLRPGATYRLPVTGAPSPPGWGEVPGVVVELTVPSTGWFLESRDGTTVFSGPSVPEGRVAGIRALAIDTVATGGCDRLLRRFVDPGPTPKDLALAISRSYAFDVVEAVRPIHAFGLAGVHVVLQLAAAVDTARCLDFNLRTYRSMEWFSELVELWVLDAHGTRVVIDRSWFPDTSKQVLEQQQAIIASLKVIERCPATPGSRRGCAVACCWPPPRR